MLEEDARNNKEIKEIVGSCSKLVNEYRSDSPRILEHRTNVVVHTGIDEVDIELVGMWPGDLVLLTSKSAVERNIVAVNIVAHVLKWEKVSTIIFSGSRTKKEILASLLAIDSRVSLKDIIEGTVSFGGYDEVKAAAYNLCDAPLIIDDGNDQSLQGIMERTKTYRTDRFRPGLIVMDNVSVNELKESDGHDRLVKKLKDLASEMCCIFLILSGLPDNDGKTHDRKPGIKDLRSISVLFGYIDSVLLAYCKGLRGEDFFDPEKGIMEIMIPKTREGPSGKTVKQRIDEDTFRLEDIKTVPDLPFIGGSSDFPWDDDG